MSQAPILTLIGRYISPPVRRVAACLVHQVIPFNNAPLSTTDPEQFAQIRRFNPLGRVPALVIPGGPVLVESGAILDYIDGLVGEERSLLPYAGEARRTALQALALGTGACDKLVAIGYELTRRPEQFRYQPWIDQCADQAMAALKALDQILASTPFVNGARLTQGDFAAAIALDLATNVIEAKTRDADFEALRRLRASNPIAAALSKVAP